MSTDRNLYTKKEIAKIISISERTITKMVSSGRIPFIKIGRLIRFCKEDVLNQLKATNTSKKKLPIPGRAAVPIIKENTKGNEVIAAWCSAYKKKYNTSYEILKKDAGILSKFGQGRNLDKIIVLFSCYLAIEDKLYVSQRHPLSLFFRDLARITNAAQSGINPIEPEEFNIDKIIGTKNDIK